MKTLLYTTYLATLLLTPLLSIGQNTNNAMIYSITTLTLVIILTFFWVRRFKTKK